VAEKEGQRRPEGLPEERELLKWIRSAEKGDQAALARVREVFDRIPHMWAAYGNTAQQAQDALIAVAAGENALAKEAMNRQMEGMRQELAGPTPTPLDRLLAERVALCWLHASYADAMYAQSMKTGCSVVTGDYLQRRQDRAHRRFLTAARTLALVQRLAVPQLRATAATSDRNRAEYLELADESATVAVGQR
jgi:hypothetical protein